MITQCLNSCGLKKHGDAGLPFGPLCWGKICQVYSPVPYHISREGFIMFYLWYRNILYDVVCKHPETGEGERSIYQYFQHTQDSAHVDELIRTQHRRASRMFILIPKAKHPSSQRWENMSEMVSLSVCRSTLLRSNPRMESTFQSKHLSRLFSHQHVRLPAIGSAAVAIPNPLKAADWIRPSLPFFSRWHVLRFLQKCRQPHEENAGENPGDRKLWHLKRFL